MFKEDKRRLLSQPIAEKTEHQPMQDRLKQTRLHRDTETAASSRSCFASSADDFEERACQERNDTTEMDKSK
jgi:hypothetical protein